MIVGGTKKTCNKINGRNENERERRLRNEKRQNFCKEQNKMFKYKSRNFCRNHIVCSNSKLITDLKYSLSFYEFKTSRSIRSIGKTITCKIITN